MSHTSGELVHIFGELVHIFAWKLVSRTSNFEKFGAVMAAGVYNDTRANRTRTST